MTPEGELLLPAIRGIVHSAEQLRQLSAAINGLSCGTVRIGAFTSVAVHWLPGMLKTFSAQYPSVEIELLSGDYHDIACWVSSGEVDIAFTAYPEELSCRCHTPAGGPVAGRAPCGAPPGARRSLSSLPRGRRALHQPAEGERPRRAGAPWRAPASPPA